MINQNFLSDLSNFRGDRLQISENLELKKPTSWSPISWWPIAFIFSLIFPASFDEQTPSEQIKAAKKVQAVFEDRAEILKGYRQGTLNLARIRSNLEKAKGNIQDKGAKATFTKVIDYVQSILNENKPVNSELNQPWITPLKQEFEYLLKKNPNKGVLFQKAYAQCTPNFQSISTHRHKTNDPFAFKEKVTGWFSWLGYGENTLQKPAHLENTFNAKNSSLVTSTPKYFDYAPAPKKTKQYWVDFANRFLAGGAFTHGFVQEEVMFAEMPGLAALGASNLDKNRSGWTDVRIRKGAGPDDHKVLKGNPTPLLINGLERTLKIDIYGGEINKLNEQQVLSKATPVNQKNINVLAIAAAKLDTNDPKEQFAIGTVLDMYNTAYAGFTLAKNDAEAADKECKISTGKLGSGAFNNSFYVAYFTQRLAALQMGIDIDFYGYEDAEYNKAETIFNEFLSGIQTSNNTISVEEALIQLTNTYKNKLGV